MGEASVVADYSEAYIAIGPWGGPEDQGDPWAYRVEGPITEIVIRHGGCIDSILFKTNKTSDDVTGFSKRFGGPGGNKTDKVLISSGEYIIGVDMMIGGFGGQSVINLLSIRTNITTYGPFGTSTGTKLSIPVTDGIIIGFFGRAKTYLNAIGIYVVAKAKSSELPKVKTKSSDFVQEYQVVKTAMKTVGPREIGPWGPLGGRAWDDGVYAGVNRVYLKLGDNKGNCEEFQVVQAIQFRYKKKDGEFVNSPIYGHIDELPVQVSSEMLDKYRGVIQIDCSNDQLMGIEGFYGSVDGEIRSDRILSLTFYTKKSMYGPYGAEIGTFFTSSPCAGRVVGFFGRGGRYLTAIGLHIDYN